MQATVQISPDGMVIANLDSDDYDDDEDARALLNLRADDMLDQCARVAIDAWFEIRSREDTEDGE
ncbi:hypothetical protein [Arthrobacter sp. Alg241-R88]|uniref:hypothetical protein n=1 Tax=Arthrobacter sp. Alg241-R88 TaxID=2305984 RepID=UPI0013D84266|nr:hypothetical protein [Arthrobacter sp. Alg241-R88]